MRVSERARGEGVRVSEGVRGEGVSEKEGGREMFCHTRARA